LAEGAADDTATDMKLLLMSLPQDVTHYILEYLLLTSHVKSIGPSEACARSRYQFQVQVLRCCTGLYVQGRAIFWSNHFVLVSTKCAKIPTALREDNVPYFNHNSVSHFKGSALRIHVSSRQPALDPSISCSFFLLCRDDVPSLVSTLQLLDLSVDAHFNIKINVKPAITADFHSLKTQTSLLTPFADLCGRSQECNIDGFVEPVLAQRIELRMTQRVHWSWARYVLFLKLLLKKDRRILQLYEVGHHTLAADLNASYGIDLQSLISLEILQQSNRSLQQVIESAMTRQNNARMLLGIKSATKITDTHLARAQFRRVTQDSWFFSLTRRHSQYPYLARLRGVAFFGQYKFDAARDDFEGAEHEDRGHPLSLLGLVLCAMLLDSLAQVNVQYTAAEFVQGHQEALAKLNAILPGNFNGIPASPQPFISAGRNQDLYALKVLGYVGDKLEGQVQQRAGWSVCIETGAEVPYQFNEEEVDDWLRPHLRERAGHVAHGVKSPDLVIGWH
jgi:hypothetical protein